MIRGFALPFCDGLCINNAMTLRHFPSLLLILCLMLLGACGSDSTPDTEEETTESAETLYTKARDHVSKRQFIKAAELFDEVERQHPYSKWAPVSQIMAAYSYYNMREYDDAIFTLSRFIDMYPGNNSIDYAYYLTAISYYEQISDVGRDQGMTSKANKALTDVIRRYPQSAYARDARLKRDLTNDHLAGKEMSIGRYYLNKKEYLAAANRFRNVIEGYETTTHTPEALHRLVETYLLLGVKEQAERYAAVMGHNYPNSPWYERSYALLRGDTAKDATKLVKPDTDEDEAWWDIL